MVQLRSQQGAGSAFGARAWVCAAALSVVAGGGCTKPQLPRVTPLSAKVTGVGPDGIDLVAKLSAYNPNDVDLSIQSVTATVTLDGRHEIGTFKESKPVKLPAKKRTVVDVPIEAKWSDVMSIAQLALSGRDIEYLIDGKAVLGGTFVNVELPFQMKGIVTQAQMKQAAARAIPKIPGLQIPGMP
jgi:LEA14-like dessication related protein